MDETRDATEQAPATASGIPAAADSWLGLSFNLCVSLVIIAGALSAYHYLIVVPGQQKLGFVDVAEILRLKELEVTARMAQAGKDAEGEAYDAIRRFSADMEAALDDLQHECACALLVRSALVKSGTNEDFTTVLKQRLGLDRLDQNQLMRQIGAAGGRDAVPALGSAPGSDRVPPYR